MGPLRDLPIQTAETDEVLLLIGQDAPGALAPLNVVRGRDDEPYAIQTRLGWTVSGPVSRGGRNKSVKAHFVSSRDDALSEQVERFWQLESSGLCDEEKGLSAEDISVIKKWNNTATYEEGHHQLPIPFRRENPALPDNLMMAKRRLASLGRKLDKNPVLNDQYVAGIQDLLDKGHAIPVPKEELQRQDGKVWYLPHHPVLSAKKEKPRIVFDCAAQCGDISLNSAVLPGPDLTNRLVGVLGRFRIRRVAFMADVEAMFHQVRVPRADQDVLRFLWWPNNVREESPAAYRMTVHLFGGTWSPSCCAYALHKTANDNASRYSDAALSTVRRDFYVDDCLKSVDTTEEAVILAKELKSLLSRGGFHLTKWTSNDTGVLKEIPSNEHSTNVKERGFDSPLQERALGVHWDVLRDSFGYDVLQLRKPHTRRGYLSMLSSIYDPMGLASPFILKARKIVQDLCRRNLGWDDPVPEASKTEWERWANDLDNMTVVKFPRCLISTSPKSLRHLRLHHFADASELAYGVTSYLRAEDEEGHVTCTLVMAKSRLAPLKQQTIPRLELCAATLATRQDAMLRRELDIQMDTSQFWSDSTLVLQYIKSQDRRFLTFVANRVAEIRSRTNIDDWRHVPTKDNPADDASRGLTAQELNGERWQHGPPFLRLPPDQWPEKRTMSAVTDQDPEVKTEKALAAVINEAAQDTPTDTLLHRFSSWRRLLRAVAWLLLIKQTLKDRSPPVRALEECHIIAAESAVLGYVQQKHLANEISKARLGTPLPRKHPFAKLRPRLVDGLLRVEGRLKRAGTTADRRGPIIIPRESKIAGLLVRHHHERSAHAGREYVLAELQQHYWLVGARYHVRRVLSKCVTCRKREARPCAQLMGDLPDDRVTPGQPPFTNVGVDYFGPIHVKRGRGREKRYGCLFTCLTTRAIHLEVAHALDTDAFLNALFRFIARRGQPQIIRSDNGRNLVGGERELREEIDRWSQSWIQAELSDRRIRWLFNPPSASHMGGVWERQIRTVRRVLAGLTNEQLLSDDMLSTLMCLAESIVNNRPLTPVSDDPRDFEALTPNHLLLLRSGTIPPGDYHQTDLSSRKKWRQVQYLADLFWKRWVREYLPQLRQRTKWIREERDLTEGDIVLVIEHPLPRNEWRLGRVIKPLPGPDGHVRSVRLQTKDGICTRPIAKVCMLEETD